MSPTKGLLTVVLLLTLNFLEGKVITRLLERRIVRLPPTLAMTAQILSAAAFGLFDVLIPIDPREKRLAKESNSGHFVFKIASEMKMYPLTPSSSIEE